VDFWQTIEDRLRGKRVLILGIGNKMRGDDGAGSVLATQLAGRVNATVIDAEEVPENYLGPVIADSPEVLLILDAASMEAPPGSLAIIEMDNIASSGLSTHSASLNLFLLVLQSEILPDTFVLGIQPQTIEFGALISPAVRKAMEGIDQALFHIFPQL
jgi:hydrogenase 3 maturation protease